MPGNALKNGAHLVLLLAAILAAVAVFLVVRHRVVPEEFGRYGHYRPGALDDNRAQPVSFAGRRACVDCHGDTDELLRAGKHRRISCETCHGPQAAHAADPGSGTPPRPKVSGLCERCHEADAAKPAHFPQVASARHAGGAVCNSCHQPHKPGLERRTGERR